jgi:hypothetical protein
VCAQLLLKKARAARGQQALVLAWPVRAMLLSDRRCCLVACKYILGPSSITMFCELLYGRCIFACGARDIAYDTCRMSPSPRRPIDSIGCWNSPRLRSQCLCPCCEWRSKTSRCSDMLTRGIVRSLRPRGSLQSPYNYSALIEMFVRVLAVNARSLFLDPMERCTVLWEFFLVTGQSAVL